MYWKMGIQFSDRVHGAEPLSPILSMTPTCLPPAQNETRTHFKDFSCLNGVGTAGTQEEWGVAGICSIQDPFLPVD